MNSGWISIKIPNGTTEEILAGILKVNPTTILKRAFEIVSKSTPSASPGVVLEESPSRIPGLTGIISEKNPAAIP